MNKVFLSSLLIAASSLLVMGCDKTREQFDFSKKAPDEFAIMTRAPLEMPPSVSSLPAPRPGAARPQEKGVEEMARQSILGEGTQPAQARAGVTQGESILLQKTGAANANPAIRDKVNQETAEIAEQQSPGIDKLKKMVGMNVEPPAKVINPVEEVERLRKNQAVARPGVDANNLSRQD